MVGRLFFFEKKYAYNNNVYRNCVMIHEITVFSVSITIQRSYHLMALFLFIL
jgi:hypothetical protein